jgi:hypothetical protein
VISPAVVQPKKAAPEASSAAASAAPRSCLGEANSSPNVGRASPSGACAMRTASAAAARESTCVERPLPAIVAIG